MRARSLDIDQFAGARHGVSNGVVGIGEPVSRKPESLSEAILLSSDEHGEKAGRMLVRFAELPPDTMVWTQTGPEEFRLGRIRGDWFHDDSLSARATGIANARPAEWLDRIFGPGDTPLAVIDSFGRGGRNFQRIRNQARD